ncbi:hypothetical protein Pmani_035339 [Petrolisthes manimaculis]|uniref:Uncharacterized protein n=1 Tax=Petrolisthes manimaculis TaxID=1843537 RepID=A0AAE1TQM1_9EUCA|nr:hypothetical protein Pmani_035339 [Petrolisthes manimaculis]
MMCSSRERSYFKSSRISLRRGSAFTPRHTKARSSKGYGHVAAEEEKEEKKEEEDEEEKEEKEEKEKEKKEEEDEEEEKEEDEEEEKEEKEEEEKEKEEEEEGREKICINSDVLFVNIGRI